MTEPDAVALAEETAVGHLVTRIGDRIESGLIPFVLDRTASGVVVRGHLTGANPQRASIEQGDEALLIVHGGTGYVSPSLYPSKQEGGRVVPTLNYAVVHLRGRLRPIEGHDGLRAMVSDLTDRFEVDRDEPWQVDDAPEEFVAAQLKAIVGFELTVQSVEGVAKVSQNRAEPDRTAVRDAFLAGGEQQRSLGEMMR